MTSNAPHTSDGLAELLAAHGRGQAPEMPLPPGRVVRADLGNGPPVVWMSDTEAEQGAWARLHAEHPRTGLWPLLLDGLPGDGFYPWGAGELFVDRVTAPELHDAEALLAEWFDMYTGYEEDHDRLSEQERIAITAPFGQEWPGLAPAFPVRTPADTAAAEYTAYLLPRHPTMRLGLVVAEDGPRALAASGWTGAANYRSDNGEVAAVLDSWARRYATRVVAAGSGTLYLSVGAPPTTTDQALHIAAEHFALCPDNIWQSKAPYTLASYAERLVGNGCWEFWWD